MCAFIGVLLEEDWSSAECGGILLSEEWMKDVKAQALAQATPSVDEEKRSFRGRNMPRLADFFERVRAGQVRVLGVRDFGYRDGTARTVSAGR